MSEQGSVTIKAILKDGVSDKAESIKKKLGEIGDEGKEAGKKTSEGSEKGEEGLGKLGEAAGTAKSAIMAIGKAVAAAFAVEKIVSFGNAAVDAFARYEQLQGGVETLFKSSSDAMMKYASDAYITAGLSANDYMETVTSFSASLIQSLEGDTEAAVKAADRAVTDMADNANKMGTPIENIQVAYAGFAKQNYTMLDNLKLGYGGTKEEMERLIKKANELRAAQGLNNDLTIESFADVVEAIHTVQTDLEISGITMEEYNQLVESGAMTAEEAYKLLGTTAKEANFTVEGSFNAMKAAFDNLLSGLGNKDADVADLMQKLVGTFKTWLNNVIPVTEQVIASTIQLIVDNAPEFLEQGIQFFDEMVIAASEKLPELIPMLANLIVSLIGKLISSLPDMLYAAGTLFGGILQGLFSIFDGVNNAIAELIANALGALFDSIGEMVDAGANIVQGIADGIASGAINVWNAIKNVCANALDAVKSFFGIHSPSTVMRDLFKYVPEGAAVGIEKGEDKLLKATDSMLSDTQKKFDAFNPNLDFAVNGSANWYQSNGEFNSRAVLGGSASGFELFGNNQSGEGGMAPQIGSQQAAGNTFNVYMDVKAEDILTLEKLMNVIQEVQWQYAY